MRWKLGLFGLALAVAGFLGCKQQCYITECDRDHYAAIGLSEKIVDTPGTSIAPEANCPQPSTVYSPERPPRYISLAECIAIALEQGTVGNQNLNLNPVSIQGFPTSNDNLISFTGAGVAGDDSIRALALDPATAAADIEGSLAKFDTHWQTSLTWNNTDEPIATAAQEFQASAAPGISAIQQQDANLSTSLWKPLPTGGTAGITFSTAYELSNLLPAGSRGFNPSWQPNLTFSFEQPLLQGFGIEINELRPTHPTSLLDQNLLGLPVGGRVEGILITRLRFDEARTEFERNLNFTLANVEIAYWTLYGAYWNLYSQEQGLRQSYEAWRINKSRFEAGRINMQDFAQTRGQYESFRDQRISALGALLEAERQLRKMMGLPVEDGCRLVPVDEPTLTPYVPEWNAALSEALNLRPELILARQEIKFHQMDLIRQKNLLLPDLRFVSSYDINAAGTRLDTPQGAFGQLGADKFNNWQIGLQMDVPLGFRDAYSAVRSSRLQLARSYNVLRDQELKAQQFLALQYRRLFETYENIIARRAAREAYAQQLEGRFREFIAGRGTLDFLLEAQRNWANALSSEYQAIVNYNATIVAFQFAKGTIMQYDNVVVAEGELPKCAQVRARDHAKERADALVLAERALPQEPICVHEGKECDPLMKLIGVPREYCNGPGTINLPAIPEGQAPSVPSLYKNATPLPDLREPLPKPRPTPTPPEANYLPDSGHTLFDGTKPGMLPPTP
jgi:outer membrane protein TolC